MKLNKHKKVLFISPPPTTGFIRNDKDILQRYISNTNIFHWIGRKRTGIKKANRVHDLNGLMQSNRFFDNLDNIAIKLMKLFYVTSYIKGGMEV